MHPRFLVAWLLTTALTVVPGVASERGTASHDGDRLRQKSPPARQSSSTSRARFARGNYVWPYATGPYYGDVEREARHEVGVVRTAVGSFRLADGFRQLPAELRSSATGEAATRYHIVALDRQEGASRDLRKLVESTGGRIVGSLPVAAYIVRMTPETKEAVENKSYVVGVTPYHTALRISPIIGRVPLLDPTKALSEIYELTIRIFPGEEAEAIAAAMRKLGAHIEAIYPDTLRVEIHRSKLAEIAAVEGVQQVFESLPAIPLGEETTATIQTGALNGGPGEGSVPYHDAGVDGGGGGLGSPQILMVLDTGIQIDAGDLADSAISPGTPGQSHRKVLFYGPVTGFAPGAAGDDRGCDSRESGGYTHGHVVASTALGAGTRVPGGFGDPFYLEDNSGNRWRVDGVAPGAKLVAYDAHVTPAFASCEDVRTINVPDDLTDVMQDGYDRGARVIDFSWGTEGGGYDARAQDIDAFLVANGDAMVFVAAGNAGADETKLRASDSNRPPEHAQRGPRAGGLVPDSGTITAPATAKNSLAIGASHNADDLSRDPDNASGPGSRWPGSSVGPVDGRIVPQLMAPGWDDGTTGLDSEFICGTADNDQMPPVECQRNVAGLDGTSYAVAAAAGAALLVRDWFTQGFYPDGRNDNPTNAADQVANISGALLKSVLITSAQFMNGENLIETYRFNNEQGYGRIQLNRALPLSSLPIGMIVADGGIVAGQNDLPGLTGELPAGTSTQTATFEVCDPSQELKIALSWIDTVSGYLLNDLDLEVESPSGKTYFGNYFTDDNDRNGLLDPGEDCPGIDPAEIDSISSSEWSLPACVNSVRDTGNPTEGVFLSPDPLGCGTRSQTESGTWTIRVKGNALMAAQRYAVAIVGGVCIGSRITLDRQDYSCNGAPTVTVNEFPEAGDPNPTDLDITNRTVIQVVDSTGSTVLDEETGISFSSAGGLSFTSDPLILTDSTIYDIGNGVLDVRHGDQIRAIYRDEINGIPDPDRERTSTAPIDCLTRISFGDVLIPQFGRDVPYLVVGGCEGNGRNSFEFGFPDRYLDADESVSLKFAFASLETQDLENATLALRCAIADVDSPEGCRPNSADCADPNRLNNPSCDGIPSGNIGDRDLMTILDSPLTVGLIPAGQALYANFSIQMADNGTFHAGDPTPEVELLLAVTAATVGKTVEGLAVSRHTLNVDEESFYYSTDYPTGGIEYFDGFGGGSRGNDEVIQGLRYANQINDNQLSLAASQAIASEIDVASPQTSLGDLRSDYRFEAWQWSDLTATGKNLALGAPWNFDVTDGGFQSGISAATNSETILSTIAQWGEDKNFNGIDDRRCTNDIRVACIRDVDCPPTPPGTCQSVEQRDPADSVLDKSWNTRGGCGWVTKAPGSCSNIPTLGCYEDADCFGGSCTGPAPTTGGAWHTGRIGGTTMACLVTGDNPGQCQSMEVVGGATGQRVWFELLRTPVIEKVNGPEYAAEIIDMQWNQTVDLPDDNAVITWELDNDVDSLQPVDLAVDLTVLNGVRGGYGAVTGGNNPALTDGFSLFADPCPATARSRGQGPITNVCSVDTGTNSNNGVLGNNRQAKNSCFFEGGAVTGDPLDTLGLPRPFDDDYDNDGDGQIDEFVAINGPKRNMDLSQANGPDMRFLRLEDIYGDTGTKFQGAIGIRNEEKESPSVPDPAVGFGLAVDDVVVQWREFRLIEDTADCATAGECAVLDVAHSRVFDTSGEFRISLTEKTPQPVNDCDQDCVSPSSPSFDPACFEGGFTSDRDCDADGVDDVPVRATSAADPIGEVVILNATGTPNHYEGTLAYSTRGHGPGTLFVAAVGSEDPVISVEYRDYDNGAGDLCQNLAEGKVQTIVAYDASGKKPVKDRHVPSDPTPLGGVTVELLTDDGDNDGFADTGETVDMTVRVTNNSQTKFKDLEAHLSTSDPNIACISNPTIFIGDILPGGEATSVDAFIFTVADVDRSTLGLTELDPFTATFTVILSTPDFVLPFQKLTLELDLDAAGGSGPTTFFEGFEGASGFGAFTTMNLDAGRSSLVGSDGYRCQYHDPDWVASNSYGVVTDCFLGGSAAIADAFHWQVHKTSDIDGGRAYGGSQSLYMGIFGSAPDEHTTPMGVMEAVRTTDPINLGLSGAAPELSFKQQVSLVDGRSVYTADDNRTADRAVVQLQLADDVGNPIGDWIKLQPYLNVHDQRAADNFFQCTFDPIDDGNDEDTFFETLDQNPLRRLGPSSTCYGGGFTADDAVFAHIGNTFQPFNPNALGGASVGPGLRGQTGLGTWIESRFSLFRFKGRRVRLRFLTSHLKLNSNATWEDAFMLNPDPGDDGWWIDDVTVSNTLVSPTTFANDNKTNSGLPGCGATCTTVSADLVADPANVPAPGQVVELSAVGSVADTCVDGALQFRFWIDGDGDGQGGDALDTLLRGWTDRPTIVLAPVETAAYVADVRCSSLTTCADTTSLTVQVDCPSTGSPGFPKVLAVDAATLGWGSSLTFDFAEGLLSTLSFYGLADSGQYVGPSSTFDVSADVVAPGTGRWYLFRESGPLGSGGTGLCNDPGISWGSAARDSSLP